jgi:hypothetical protein
MLLTKQTGIHRFVQQGATGRLLAIGYLAEKVLPRKVNLSSLLINVDHHVPGIVKVINSTG